MRTPLFFAPATVDEALALLNEYGADATVLAGGTDVVRDMNLGLRHPKVLVYVGRLGLEYVRATTRELVIGAATRMSTLLESPLVREHAAVLAEGAANLGSPLTRSLATVGGNIVNASPAADTATPLLALDAKVVLVSKRGTRTMPIDKFFAGPKMTVRKPNELVKEFRIPLDGEAGGKFIKLERRKALSLSVVNVAVTAAKNGGPMLEEVRIALGAVAPTPVRSVHAEELLLKNPLSAELIEEAAQAAVKDIKPISDVHGSAWYRTKVTPVLVARALRAALGEVN